MATGKTIKKTLPYELYDAAGLEDWFARMAAEGLHLVSCSGERAAFTPGEPKAGVRFRLEAQGFYETDLKKNDEYAQSGWEHVTTIRGFFYVFRCDDPAAEELHTDPEIQSYTMKKLMRRQWRWFILWPLYWAFLLRDLIKMLFTAPAMLPMNLVLRDAAVLAAVGLIVSIVSMCWCQAVQLSALRRMQKRLASGEPMDRSRRYPRSFWRHGFLWIIIGMMFGLIPLSVWLDHETRDIVLEDYPHVTLEDVFTSDHVSPDPENEFWNGTYPRMRRSSLTPVQLTYHEYGVTEENGNGESVRIALDYYQSVSDGTARLLLDGAVAEVQAELKESKKLSEMEIHNPVLLENSGLYRVEHAAFDELYALDYQFDTTTPQRYYFGRLGNEVVVLLMESPYSRQALDQMAAQLGGA